MNPDKSLINFKKYHKLARIVRVGLLLVFYECVNCAYSAKMTHQL